MKQLFCKQLLALLSFLLYLSNNLHGTNAEKKPLVISLGANCQVALQLRKNKVQTLASPFDWVISPFAGVYSLFKNDFKDFLNPVYLIKNISKEKQDILINKVYGIEFWHDFPLDSQKHLLPHYLNYLDKINARYQDKIKRLYTLLNSNTPVYIVRCRSTILQAPLTKQDALNLKNMFLQKFPQGNWHIIFLDFTNEIKEDWHIDRVKNSYMPQPFSDSEYWMGDDKQWRGFLSDLQVL